MPTQSLYTYQDTGADWLASQSTAFLADEMGVGKTIQAIVASDRIGAAGILVIAPASALYNWRSEFAAWSTRNHLVQVLDYGKARISDAATVVVVTPKLAQVVEIKLQLLGRPWGLLIVDEADCYKSFEAAQTIAFYGTGCLRQPGCIAGDRRARVWLLSGTPCPNHVGELWTHVRALRPEAISFNRMPPFTYQQFIERYTISKTTRFGPKVLGNRPDTLSEVRARVIEPFMLRRLKSEVLPHFPPIRYEVRTVSTDKMPADLRRLEREVGPRITEYLDALNAQADTEELVGGGFQFDASEALGRLEKIDDDHREHLAKLRRWHGLLKVTPTIELIEAELAAHPNDKLIVFAQHLDVIEALQAACIASSVKITGAVSARDRYAYVEQFQTDPECKVFFGQLHACSTAITLTASHEVLFVESSWVPRDMAQAAARAHRIGQNNHVRVRLLALEGSSDSAVMATLARKVRMISELFA